MSAVERVQAALASASNDVTALLLTNSDNDFSLLKVEAPEEYQALGNYLSTERRSNAEEGTPHTTARKLGALFEGVVPATPNLLKAYGKRMCHIASATFVAVQECGDFGIIEWSDATSLWAAVTSGSSALQVWFLTCIIVRTGSGDKATSLWMKLIERRKKEIARKYEQNQLLSHCTIAVMRQQSPSREQLAEWDASARAWLLVADVMQRMERGRFMYAISHATLYGMGDNLNKSPYDRSMETWKTTMTVMENLLTGTPQDFHNESLLFLEAFHIYPNVIDPGDPDSEVKSSDELVPSGGTLRISTWQIEATKASSLESIQGLTRRINRTRTAKLSPQERSSLVAENLSTVLRKVADHPSSFPGELRHRWNEQRLPNSAFVVEVPSDSTMSSGGIQFAQDDRTAANEAHNTAHSGSPHSITNLRSHPPHTTVNVRQVCLRHITMIGATIILFSSMATALVLIYAVGHSISDAFTAAAWVFPAGAILLYVIKSCLGGEVEERILPFS